MKQLAILFLLAVTAFCATDDEALNQKYKINRLTAGDGTTFPAKGQSVDVHYVGTLPTTGKQFDSSRARGTPFSFTVGSGMVIRCWEEVVAQMSIGEKIYVICPSDTAYGSRGAGGLIPPNSDIAFEVELLGIKGVKKDL